MRSPLEARHSNALLLMLLNSLADFDGEISDHAVNLLNELQQRSTTLPPLYADVFGLPSWSTCADLVQRIHSLSAEQIAIASYAFQIFRSYEQMLRVDTTQMAPEQRAASESQMERLRLLVSRSRSAIAESFGEIADEQA